MPKKDVSISSELKTLLEGVRGVYALNRRFIESFGMETDLPEAMGALLAILIERLRLMDRVVRGTVDPALLWCVENDAASFANASEEDHVLPEWSEKRLARHHRREWKRARSRLRSKPSAKEPSR